MVGAYKKVIATYVVIIIKRWPMRRDKNGKLTPLQLYGVLQLLPGKYGAMMNFLLIKLGRSTGKDRIDFPLIEALAVTVEKGYIANA